MTVSVDLRTRLRAGFTWRGDRTDDGLQADLTQWWRDPQVLSRLGAELAALFPTASPTVVVGVEASGFLLGPLVALSLGVGFLAVRKEPDPASDSDAWLREVAVPDHRDRHLELGFRRRLLRSGDRALMVDDWAATGSQAEAVRSLVGQAGASWCGAAVVVDAMLDHRLRRDLDVRSLLHERDL